MSAMFPQAPQLSFPPNPFTQASPFAPFLPRAPAPAAAPVPIPAPALAAYQRASSCDEAEAVEAEADVSEQGSQAGEQLALENVSNASSGSPQSQSGPSPPPGAGAPHCQSPFAGASNANGASNPLQMLQRQLSLQSQVQQQQQHALRLDDASDAGGERRPSVPPPPHNSVGRGRGGGGGMLHRVSSADGCLSIVNYLMQFYLPSSEPEQFAKKVHF